MMMNTNLSRRWTTVSVLLLAFVVLGVALVAWVVAVDMERPTV